MTLLFQDEDIPPATTVADGEYIDPLIVRIFRLLCVVIGIHQEDFVRLYREHGKRSHWPDDMTRSWCSNHSRAIRSKNKMKAVLFFHLVLNVLRFDIIKIVVVVKDRVTKEVITYDRSDPV